MNTNITVRKAVEADYQAVNALYSANYNQLHQNLPDDYKMPPERTLYRGSFINMIEAKDEIVYVAEIEGKVVGMLAASVETGEENEWSHDYRWVSIDELSVLPECQRQGVGTALLNKIEEWAKEQKASLIKVLTHDFNQQSLSFYRKNGLADYSIVLRKKI